MQVFKKFNVIVILVDDLGYGDLKCYGVKNVEIFYVDKLVLEGICFINVYIVVVISILFCYFLLIGEYVWCRLDMDIVVGDVKMIICFE